MTGRPVTECGACGSDRLESVLSVGSSPPTCVMTPTGGRRTSETHYPLELLVCQDCTLAQLSVVVDPEVVFPPDYPYSSGNSRGLHSNFEDLAREATDWVGGFGPDDLVVDIGANDGTLLSKFGGGCRTVGVEPTGQWRKITGPAYQEFFSEAVARRILADHGPAKVITACNVLAHVDDIADVMRGINVLLADDGVFIAENHDLASVVEGQWDTVYHEHLRFYDPYSFDRLLMQHGFGSCGWKPIPTHGGSFRIFCQRGEGIPLQPRGYDFELLALRARDARNNLRSNLADYPRPAWGIGATARATTIINYCGLDVDDIECVCEVAGSDKIGHYIPGTSIPVVDEARLFEDQPPRAVLFSWHLADVIVPKLRERGYTGEIIVPLPTLQTA